MRSLSFLLSILPLAAGFNARRSTLTDCLNAASVPILLATSNGWADEIRPYNLRFTPTPTVVALPRTQSEVQAAVGCAYKTNTRVSVKAGGHSYGAFGLSGALVIDMVEFQTVSYNAATGVATVGAGVRLGNMARKLFELGQRGLPHGSCAGVGIGGHATLGGFGLVSRSWGLALDNVQSLSAVLANGTAVTVSSSKNADLFWALRGAGPGFAVVTEFKMKTFAAPPVNINWAYTYMFTSASKAANAFHVAQTFGNSVPKELGYGVLFFSGGSLIVRGVYYGKKAGFDKIIAPLLVKMRAAYEGKEPTRTTVNTMGWIESLTELSGSTLVQPVKGYNVHDTFYAKSIATKESKPLSLNALKGLFTYLYNTSPPGGAQYMVLSNLYGGPGSVINSFPPSHDPASTSSYAHRDISYVFQFYAYTGNQQPPFNSGIPGFVKGMVNALGTEAADLPAYAPYADPELTRAEAQKRYWGDGVARLSKIKKSVDPNGILYNPQGF